MGLSFGLGSVLFGKIADCPNLNRILLQQIAIASIGFCNFLSIATSYLIGFEFESLIISTIIMGISESCYNTLFLPIAYDICGPYGASQAIGFVEGLLSFPFLLGPPIAGKLNDS